MNNTTVAPNANKPYTDAQLTEILSAAHTSANCDYFAMKFGRTPAAIANIYRWAATPMRTILAGKRAESPFVLRIKRIAKEIGLINL